MAVEGKVYGGHVAYKRPCFSALALYTRNARLRSCC